MKPEGVFYAVTTQFRRNQWFDLPATATEIERLIDHGAQGLILLSPAAESETLSRDEKLRIIEIALNTAHGRIPVLSAVHESSTTAAQTFIREAVETGIDGLLIPSPTSYSPDERELIQHFKSLAKATRLPVIIQNNTPHNTIAILEKLAGQANVTALYSPTLTEEDLDTLTHQFHSRFSILGSMTTETAVARNLQGLITSAGAIHPAQTSLFWTLCQSSSLNQLQNVLSQFTPLLQASKNGKYIQHLKLALKELGFGSEWVRAPRLPLTGRERKQLIQSIRQSKKTTMNPLNQDASNPKPAPPEMKDTQTVRIIDSHTGGEPTRIVITGGPDLGNRSITDQLKRFQSDHDSFRSAVVNEPRGSEVLVGALLLPPSNPETAARILFFNNVGYLGMCGHGTIGLIATLAYLKQIQPGTHRIETPVGIVTAQLHDDGQASVENVPSYRHAQDVTVEIDGHGPVTGDVAWGGNWFFLVNDHQQDLSLSNTDTLIQFTWKIRQALERNGITGRDGGLIDHIELFSPSTTRGVQSKNFVLCPGKAYDRSPCGTGTSAKLACLFADGKIKEGETWRQESIIGSVFEGSVRKEGDSLIPTIKGRAHVTADGNLILNPADPFCHGIT